MRELLKNNVSRKENYLVICASFIVNFLFFYVNIHKLDMNNSDWAYYVVAGKDLFSGNFLLKGWYGSTNSFYFLDILYGLAGTFFGYTTRLLYIVSSFLWACFIVMIENIINSLSDDYSRKNYYLRLLVLILVASMSCYIHLSSWNVWAGSHLDACILGMLYVYIICDGLDKGKIEIRKIIPGAVLLFLALFSDTLVFYFAVLPLLLGLCYELLLKNKKLKLICTGIVTTIGVVVLEKIWVSILIKIGGIYVGWNSAGITFVSRDEFFSRLAYTLECYMTLFSANVFGNTVTFSNLAVFINLAMMLIFIVIVYKNIGCLKIKTMNIVLLCLLTVQLLIFMFTSYLAVNEGSHYTTRILYYSFFAITVLVCQCKLENVLLINKLKNNYGNIAPQVMIAIIYCAVLLVNVNSVKTTYCNTQPVEKTVHQKVAEVLKAKNLTYGYGTFWLANSTTLASNCELKVNGLCGGSHSLVKFNWLSNGTSGWEEANFILVDDSGWNDITRDTVLECVGEPMEEITVDNVSIMIYDYDVMPYIEGSGAYTGWFTLRENENEKNIEVNNSHFYSVFEANMEGIYVSDGEGQLIYGPYQTMPAGTYDIEFYYSYVGDEEGSDVIGYVDACTSSGTVVFQKQNIKNKTGTVTLKNIEIGDGCNDIEFRAYAYNAGLSVYKIIVKRV